MTVQSRQNPSHTPQTNGKDKCKSLDAQVEELNKSAAAGEFDKTAKAKLAEIAKGADATLQNYKDPANGRDVLVQRWKRQHERITKIRAHLEQCYPDWEKQLRECVCKTVILPLAEMRKSLRSKLGQCEIELTDAALCFAEAEKQLEA